MAQEQQAVPVPIEPAMLVIKVDQFTDANNNKVIDAGESFAIRFTIENQGKGDAYNVRLRLAEQQGYDQYFDGQMCIRDSCCSFSSTCCINLMPSLRVSKALG